MSISEGLSTGRKGVADGAASAMDRSRSVPFTANPSVVLCTQYAPTVSGVPRNFVRGGSSTNSVEDR